MKTRIAIATGFAALALPMATLAVGGPDPWVKAQTRVTFQLFKPSNTLGLKLSMQKVVGSNPIIRSKVPATRQLV